MHGKGTFTYPKGEVYEGEFNEGAIEGFGRVTKLNGSYYEGQWYRSKRHGKGEERDKDGKLIKRGHWE